MKMKVSKEYEGTIHLQGKPFLVPFGKEPILNMFGPMIIIQL